MAFFCLTFVVAEKKGPQKMGRYATGQLYPNSVRTRLTDLQAAKWDALMEEKNTDTAKALRAVICLLIDGPSDLREKVFRATNQLRRR